ncbi:MAG TPA: hypothetical protein VFG77_03045 [Nitrososphaeraceae archaeon]|nr:hypothetical protein [Nitrososphaeraceae archaeon]
MLAAKINPVGIENKPVRVVISDVLGAERKAKIVVVTQVGCCEKRL